MDDATISNALTMKVLSFKDRAPRKGIRFSRQGIRNMVLAGEFPAPMKIGKRANGFIESEVDAWLSARAAARPAAL